MKWLVNPRIGSLAVMCVLAASFTWVNAQQRSGAAVAIDADGIAGVVTSSKAPEAGVWVIADTTELATKFAKIVVTEPAVCRRQTSACSGLETSRNRQ